MAVYREMDIGTEKPRPAPAPWHLVDIADPSEDFSVARFQSAARRALAAIHERDHLGLLVGGTGLYHRAVIDELQLPGRYPDIAGALESALADEPASGLHEMYERLSVLDPLAATRIEPGNARRIVRALEVTLGSGKPYSSFGPGLGHYAPASALLIGLSLDRRQIDQRLEERLEGELEEGFLEEVAKLARREGGLSRTARQAIGYRELLAVVEDGVPLDEAKAAILRRLKSFARRQEAWFRRDPRVTWFPADAPHLAATVLELWLGVSATPSWETGS
jgi:tRNA dimethylallyltransferase